MMSNIIQFPARAAANRRIGQAASTPLPMSTKAEVTEMQLWQAITDDRVTMHYQPQYDLRTGEMVAAEALARLIDHRGNHVFPDAFIDKAEDSAMTTPFGRRTIDIACRDMANWRRHGLKLRHVSINLSANQLQADIDLCSFIDETLERHSLDYQDVEFELTERQFLKSDSQGSATLEELARRGSRITIDDFGVGYGSSVYLTQLPVSAFKIDVTMTQRLVGNRAATSVVEHLMMIAADLGLVVVAEGIESLEQKRLLRTLGCHYGQGFYFARPMSSTRLLSVAGNAAALLSPA